MGSIELVALVWQSSYGFSIVPDLPCAAVSDWRAVFRGAMVSLFPGGHKTFLSNRTRCSTYWLRITPYALPQDLLSVSGSHELGVVDIEDVLMGSRPH